MLKSLVLYVLSPSLCFSMDLPYEANSASKSQPVKSILKRYQEESLSFEGKKKVKFDSSAVLPSVPEREEEFDKLEEIERLEILLKEYKIKVDNYTAHLLKRNQILGKIDNLVTSKQHSQCALDFIYQMAKEDEYYDPAIVKRVMERIESLKSAIDDAEMEINCLTSELESLSLLSIGDLEKHWYYLQFFTQKKKEIEKEIEELISVNML